MELARPGLVAVAQVVTHAGQFGADTSLDTDLFQQIEHQPLYRVRRAQAAMQGFVRMAQAQRQAIGRAAKGGEVVARQRRMQVRRKERQPLPAPVQTAAAKVQVALAAQRTDSGRAEFLDLLLSAPQFAPRSWCQLALCA